MAGDRAGKQNRHFISEVVERFRHFSDLFLYLVALDDPFFRFGAIGSARCWCPRLGEGVRALSALQPLIWSSSNSQLSVSGPNASPRSMALSRARCSGPSARW